MVNNTYVEFLVYKIINKEINPKTNIPFSLEDIKIDEYKIEVEKLLMKEVADNGTK